MTPGGIQNLEVGISWADPVAEVLIDEIAVDDKSAPLSVEVRTDSPSPLLAGLHTRLVRLAVILRAAVDHAGRPQGLQTQHAPPRDEVVRAELRARHLANQRRVLAHTSASRQLVRGLREAPHRVRAASVAVVSRIHTSRRRRRVSLSLSLRIRAGRTARRCRERPESSGKEQSKHEPVNEHMETLASFGRSVIVPA